MALDVYFAVDARRRIASSVALVVETVQAAGGPVSADFVRGVLAMARAEALSYGLAWQDVIADVGLVVEAAYWQQVQVKVKEVLR